MTDIERTKQPIGDEPEFQFEGGVTKEPEIYDPALLQRALARLSAAAAETEEVVDELADIFAAVATKDYCAAAWVDGGYVAEVASEEMVEDVLTRHDFPNNALYEAVLVATLAIVDDMGDAWMSIKDRDALYGGDDPENFKPLNPDTPGDTNLSH
jgi:hypothetical protein